MQVATRERARKRIGRWIDQLSDTRAACEELAAQCQVGGLPAFAARLDASADELAGTIARLVRLRHEFDS